jgi:hypothetical protein
MKIRPVGAELFHVDGQTDRQTDVTKLIVAFRSIANAPKSDQLDGAQNDTHSSLRILYTLGHAL